jgi:hypothetical protein
MEPGPYGTWTLWNLDLWDLDLWDLDLWDLDLWDLDLWNQDLWNLERPQALDRKQAGGADLLAGRLRANEVAHKESNLLAGVITRVIEVKIAAYIPVFGDRVGSLSGDAVVAANAGAGGIIGVGNGNGTDGNEDGALEREVRS